MVDHRPAYIEGNDFPEACDRHCIAAAQLTDTLDLAGFDAAIVMSHHLESDREYLRQLAETDILYLGLLGPPARKERLLSELGEAGAGLVDRVHGPAGLGLGGRGPEVIALSIVAQMQQALAAD